ncbi:MAG TPA: hypothetical protein VII66_03785 [Gemmatimonadaceae bacterium]
MNDDIRHEENNSPEPVTGSLSETELDMLINRFGGDYNRATGFVPREEMWHEIQRHGSRKPVRAWPSISLIAAAVVLLAAGIGIGFELHSRGIARSTNATLATGASHTSIPRVASTTSSGNIVGDREGASPITHAPVEPVTPVLRPPASGAFASSNVGAPPSAAARSTAYSLATVRHFTAVEALLTSYQSAQHDAANDAQLAAWARSLLSQTRLLLDSPAATDPMRNKLLQDLELILVQMTQLSPANTSIDRESLDGSMNHSAVITRLRTAVPAGASTTL